MDLFDFNENEERAKPLAERMRATTLKEFAASPRYYARQAGQLYLLGTARLR